VGVVLSDTAAFRVHGRAIGPESLFIVPPGSTLHLRSPANASILAVVIETSLLREKLSAAPHIVDRLEGLKDSPAICLAPVVAERLRQDAYNALKSSSISIEGDVAQPALGELLVTSFTASLMLEWTHGLQMSGAAVPKSFARFLAIRARAAPEIEVAEIATLSHRLRLSQRSIQYACAKEGMMGFSAYNRLLRLHAVRRSLRNVDQKDRSIGDIAAEFGFLSWSHFGEQYRIAFGERPSETRGGKGAARRSDFS